MLKVALRFAGKAEEPSGVKAQESRRCERNKIKICHKNHLGTEEMLQWAHYYFSLLLPLHLLLCLSLSPPDKSIQLAMLGLRAHFLSMGRKKQFICPFWLLWWWEPGFHQDSHQELLKHKKGMLGNPTPTKDKCPTTNTVFSIKTCRRNIW